MLGSTGKLVSPKVSAKAFHELREQWVETKLVRAIRIVAGIELLAVFAIVHPATQPSGFIASSVLGFAFIVLGVAGRLRGSTVACGCFGATSSHPLGMVNVYLGLIVVATSVVNLALLADPLFYSRATAASMISIATTAWLLLAHRRRARTIFDNLINRAGSVT